MSPVAGADAMVDWWKFDLGNVVEVVAEAMMDEMP